MRSTFHELQLGKAVIQNATESGTEQLIVTLHPESRSAIEVQIKENMNGNSATSGTISIDQHGLQQLFQWLREEGAVS